MRTRKIQLTKGYETIIDADDYELISQYKWCAFTPKNKTSANGEQQAYACTSGPDSKSMLLMHRLLMGLDYGDSRVVDHINHNGFDNRRCNLQVKSHKDNSRRQKLSKANTSGYKGVTRLRNKWRARIEVDGKKIHLGCFTDIHDAAEAYNEAAIKYFGRENCVLNVVNRRVNAKAA